MEATPTLRIKVNLRFPSNPVTLETSGFGNGVAISLFSFIVLVTNGHTSSSEGRRGLMVVWLIHKTFPLAKVECAFTQLISLLLLGIQLL